MTNSTRNQPPLAPDPLGLLEASGMARDPLREAMRNTAELEQEVNRASTETDNHRETVKDQDRLNTETEPDDSEEPDEKTTVESVRGDETSVL